MKYFCVVWSLTVLTCLISCKAVKKSSLESLAANGVEKNVVLIIGAPGKSKAMIHDKEDQSDFLKGVSADVDRYKSMFQDKNIGTFETVWTYDPPSISLVNAKIDEAIGKLNDNSTLVVIYSGHGLSGSGDWDIQPDSMNLRDIYARIKAVRSNNNKGEAIPFKRIKRLIVISDSCFSGVLVERQKTSVKLPDTDPMKKQNDGLGYATELLIIAASAAQNTSMDTMIYGRGGLFSYYLARTFHKMSSSKKVTIGEWIDSTISTTNGWFSGTKQHPQYYVYPDKILNDYLFAEGSKNGTNLAMTDQVDSNCPGAYGYEWETKPAPKACISPIESCFCQAATSKVFAPNSVWGLFAPNSTAADAPISTVSTPNGADSAAACRKLIASRPDYFHSVCKDRLVYINANERLDTM